MISTLTADELDCSDLKSETTQLSVILYPADRLNEKFLIKIRQCILNLPEDHPVKIWLTAVAKPGARSREEERRSAFITEILTSKFNLITDVATKNKIIEVLIDIPGEGLAELLMKSYLYLMIGNVTRSDNILKDMIARPPVKSWLGYKPRPSYYHRLAVDNIASIVTKISRHPSDRKIWELFTRYVKQFMNDPGLLEILKENEGSQLDGKLGLTSVERIAPDFVNFLRLQRLDEKALATKLRKKNLDPAMEAYWVWYFLPVNSVISERFLPELAKVEETDPLWFIYLMENEKLSDFYSTKTGKAFMPGKRHLLRSYLEKRETFMLALWKLIEMGDIDQRLVTETIRFLTHD